MIFATIGTQAPFDRFVKMLDELCKDTEEEVICQTIQTNYQAQNIKTVDFLPPDEFDQYFKKARLIIAHAGMGTIISALKQKKPIIIVPRLASLKEHRNDHQMATAMRMHELGYVYAAYDKAQLSELINRNDLKPLKEIGEIASPSLINSLNKVIEL
ncbi:PssE/Cps14G family polysaccharide biosynthesis glycosyltransferase [Bacteroides mediterraneensis]|uniref:PssE/Cps14G family polysaccharide biosynthesis glycosyltransferase n=1 Tax=Bacteroides mediterraneensis TaxID=1841856 RepID=UPI00093395D4|nr:PssE/Cps14G family polysaccharide biosynthesis glycosyltransferase [Bacteroides mediterraneensis]